ncbi:MAG: adenylosuccinate lyase [Candidatus Pacebacteria bacterium CG1_02_43_31]|nr:MAG: adenylosuccinate lyase [Candidatus Pacebacteria bacterium CG1_02_43_31]
MVKKILICHLDDRNHKKIKDLANLFSEFSLNKNRLLIEIKYLQKLSIYKVIRKFNLEENKLLQKIHDGFDQNEFKKFKKIEKKTNHDIKALETYLRRILVKTSLKDVENFVHFCLSSEDINNIAYGLMLKENREKYFIPRINKIIEELKKLSKKSLNSPMLSLTHGQPASPTVFGKEVAVFIYRIMDELKVFSKLPIQGKLNGSVGNYNSFMLNFPRTNWQNFSQEFISDFGLEPNLYTTQILPYDSWSRYFDSVKRMNNIFLGLVVDFWWYTSFFYLKLQVIDDEVGSSAMPHKVNPIDLEAAEGNLGYSNSTLEFLSNKLQKSRMQRDLSDSTVRRNVGLTLSYSYFAYDSILRALGRLEPNSEVMSQKLDENWQVLAEAVQNILRKENIEGDYDLVKQISRGKTFNSEEFMVLINSMDIPEIIKDRLRGLTPNEYLGLAKEITLRII